MVSLNVKKLMELEKRYGLNRDKSANWQIQNKSMYLKMVREKYMRMLKAIKDIARYSSDIEEYVGQLIKKKVEGANELIEREEPVKVEKEEGDDGEN